MRAGRLSCSRKNQKSSIWASFLQGWKWLSVFLRVLCWKEVPLYCLCAVGCFLYLFIFNWKWMLDFVKACSAFFINTDPALANNKYVYQDVKTKFFFWSKTLYEWICICCFFVIFSISIWYFPLFYLFLSFFPVSWKTVENKIYLH